MMNAPRPKPYLSAITPYKAGKTSKAVGVVPTKLSSNENPYGASPKAVEAYVKAAANLHRYPESSCYDVRHRLAELHGLDSDHIICGAGSDELIGLLIHAYAGAGDEVLFTEHAFLMYKIYTLSSGATPVEAGETNLRADVEKLLAAVTERTKIVFIANPNNPTGSYLTRTQLADLRCRLPAHVLLAVDGAYAECADAPDYDDGKTLATTTNNTVMLRTFSKIYGLPFLRLGWMVGDGAIIDAVSRMKSPFNVNGAAQAAGLAALEDADWLAEQQRLNIVGKHYLIDAFRSLGLHAHDSQGNFTLVDFESREKAQHVVTALEAQNIFIRDVSAYKLPTCLRVSIGTEAHNAQLMEAVRAILA
jgi:histidinol-phosphate aminotransferase